MKWALWLGRTFAHHLSPQQLVELVTGVWPYVWKQVPRDKRVDFLTKVVSEYLGMLMSDLNRQERADLMNALLPLAVREFPLADLDLLALFPAPDQSFAQHPLSEDKK